MSVVASDSDEKLVEKLRHGDEDAYGMLFDRHWDNAFYMIYARTGDKVAAEEMAQDIFLKLWDRRATLPIATARLFISDMNHLSIAEKTPYGFEGLTKKVSSEDTSVTFSVHLDAGPIALHTWFDDEHRETLASAYYVYVRRK